MSDSTSCDSKANYELGGLTLVLRLTNKVYFLYAYMHHMNLWWGEKGGRLHNPQSGANRTQWFGSVGEGLVPGLSREDLGKITLLTGHGKDPGLSEIM